MRSRAEILGDGLEAQKAETVLTQSDLRLPLLILEALVDIRDILETGRNHKIDESWERYFNHKIDEN